MPRPDLVITVTTTADSGPGSLRDAIERANDAVGEVRIEFALDADAVIRPTTPLPALRFAGAIDGHSGSAAAGSPPVEIDGSASTPGAGLEILGGHLTVHGLAITGSVGYGIHVRGCGSTVLTGLYVGVRRDGRTAHPNLGSGIKIEQAGPVRIGGSEDRERNVVSGNQLYGIEIGGPASRDAVVQGNYIGTDATGTAAVPNQRTGLLVYNTPGVHIGGPGPGEGNVISGGARSGINIDGSVALVDEFDYAGKGWARENVVSGNIIGLDRSGDRPLGNLLYGVLVFHAQANTIVGNLISANGRDGVLVLGSPDDDECLAPRGNVLLGNRIGVMASGGAAGNGRCGVLVHEGHETVIGDDDVTGANLIANNGSVGVLFHGLGARTNRLSTHNEIVDNELGSFHQPAE